MLEMEYAVGNSFGADVVLDVEGGNQFLQGFCYCCPLRAAIARLPVWEFEQADHVV